MAIQNGHKPTTNGSMEQQAIVADMTTSRTGSFYFAYGSNISAVQMSLRLTSSKSSSVPVAIARLDAHAWIICERGYANVVALPPTDAVSSSNDNVVWGVLYNLSPIDEARLDRYEGHAASRNPHPEVNPDVKKQRVAPFLQGPWDYNKHYLPVAVTQWLVDPNQFGLELVPGWKPEMEPESGSSTVTVRALVYVDELRTKPGKINYEYIGRMNRAIREGVRMGMSSGWIDQVMRQYIPADIEVDDEGYVGTAGGYVEAEATETAGQVRERVLRECQQKSAIEMT